MAVMYVRSSRWRFAVLYIASAEREKQGGYEGAAVPLNANILGRKKEGRTVRTPMRPTEETSECQVA